ncbi:M48 family metalloprotease [Candidatus Peregrinibacteria bacterium]|nr:M48 family metalloprotease [Candidatus Peregrinibacteria bacterium]
MINHKAKISIFFQFLAILVLLAAFIVGIYFVVAYWTGIVFICTKCLGTFSKYVLNPFHLSGIFLTALLGIGLVKGFYFGFKQVVLSKRAKEKLKLSAESDSANSFAFTIGLFKPEIFISRALTKRLSKQELEAVLEHEKYHQLNYHPLQFLNRQIIQRILFFIPGIKALNERQLLEAEINADNSSISQAGKKPLASALLKTSQHGLKEVHHLQAIAGFCAIEHRVENIIDGSRKPARNTPIFAGLLVLVLITISTFTLHNLANAKQAAENGEYEYCISKMM